MADSALEVRAELPPPTLAIQAKVGSIGPCIIRILCKGFVLS
eukprot:COSAG04_NODE_2330_length_4324_cov_2.131124_7_plen_41_part_01